MGHVYILATILLTVYGQLIIKWQMMQAGILPVDFAGKVVFLLRLLLNGWILSAFLAAFLASLAWMAAMTRFQLSYAYPYMGLVFALLLLASVFLFHEAVTWPKLIGTVLIVVGVVVVSQG